MIDFKNNTYFVRQTEKDEVIEILKKYPQYRGFEAGYVFESYGFEKDSYDLLWQQIDEQCQYSDINIIYLDNEYITDSNIRQHPWLIGLAEVYSNDDYVQHKPKPLLPELKKIDRQLMRVE